MAVKTYKYNDKTQLTEHFNVQEWKCKCGKKHDIKIHSDLPPLLEKLMEKIGATVGNIYSGYRCATHDKNVGGNGSSNRSHGGPSRSCTRCRWPYEPCKYPCLEAGR